MSKYSLSAERNSESGPITPRFSVNAIPQAVPQLAPVSRPPASGGGIGSFFSTYKKPILIGTGIVAAGSLLYYFTRPKRKRSLGKRRSRRRR